MVTPKVLHWICNVPIGLTLVIFGIIGNAISVNVWRRLIMKNKQGNPSTAIYLVFLGVCDIGLLFFFLLTETISSAEPSIKNNYHYAAFFSWFAFPMLYFFVVTSIWTVVSVTINRWVLIVLPTRSKYIYTEKKTYFSIAAILVCSLLINIPHWFSFQLGVITNGTVVVIEKTEYSMSQGSINYEFWCHCIVLVLVPWFTVAALNLGIVKRLRDRRTKISFVTSLPKRERQDGNITAMLLAVTSTFLLLIGCQCVTQCLYMLEYKKHDDIESWYRVDKSFAFGKLGVVINSSTNPIFYCFYGTSFRKELKKTLSVVKISVTTDTSSWVVNNIRQKMTIVSISTIRRSQTKIN